MSKEYNLKLIEIKTCNERKLRAMTFINKNMIIHFETNKIYIEVNEEKTLPIENR